MMIAVPRFFDCRLRLQSVLRRSQVGKQVLARARPSRLRSSLAVEPALQPGSGNHGAVGGLYPYFFSRQGSQEQEPVVSWNGQGVEPCTVVRERDSSVPSGIQTYGIEEKAPLRSRDFVEGYCLVFPSFQIQAYKRSAFALASLQERGAKAQYHYFGNKSFHWFLALSLAQVSFRFTVRLKIRRFSLALSGSTQK